MRSGFPTSLYPGAVGFPTSLSYRGGRGFRSPSHTGVVGFPVSLSLIPMVRRGAPPTWIEPETCRPPVLGRPPKSAVAEDLGLNDALSGGRYVTATRASARRRSRSRHPGWRCAGN